MTMAVKPRVYVIGTGGTISRIGHGRTDYTNYNYKTGNYSIEDLLARIPEAKEIAEVRSEQFANSSSSDLGPDQCLGLSRRINRIFEEDEAAAGVVLTHGTATLEETSYFLNLTVRSHKPVAVTGAMRPPTAISADGDLNLLDAVRTAASPHARDKGVLVVMNNEINAARDVTKSDSHRVHTMQSRNLGILGLADSDGEVVFYRQPTHAHTAKSEFDPAAITSLPRVDIVPSYSGADGFVIDALVNAAVPGIIAAGLGSGSGPVPYMRALERAVKQGVTVMVASQSGSGRIVQKRQFADCGILAADNLGPKKARILLMLALAHTKDASEIQRMASTY